MKQAKRFSTIHYSLGLISVFASAAASFTGLTSDNKIIAASLAGIGAISSGIIAFVNFLKESERRWLAWKLIDGECLEFELRSDLSEGKLDAEHLKLVRVVRIGEDVIGGNISREAIQKLLEAQLDLEAESCNRVEECCNIDADNCEEGGDGGLFNDLEGESCSNIDTDNWEEPVGLERPQCAAPDVRLYGMTIPETHSIIHEGGGVDTKIDSEDIKQFQHKLIRANHFQEPPLSYSDTTKDLDLVDCSVFSPSSVVLEDMFLVQVYVHLPEEVDVAKQQAQQFDSEAKQLGVKTLGIPIERGSELTFHLSIPNLEVDEPIQKLSWYGRANSVQFGVTVPAKLNQKIVIGTVTVSQNTIPIGHLKFKLSIVTSTSSVSKDSQPVGEVAQHYRKAFVSYSSKDRVEVLKRVQGLLATGITVFQDVLNLAPGDRWEKELYRNIDECDIFLLFWSTAAKESPWVLKEVLYALEKQGADGLRPPAIIPVIIEGPPLVPPPQELQNLHFNDKILYLLAASE